jgi:hypothetical protein
MIDPVTQDLNHHLNQESAAELRAEAIDKLVGEMELDILNDEPEFQQLCKDYGIDVDGQVMRALRSFDNAMRRFNLIYNVAQAASPSARDTENLNMARHGIDAVFTSLNNIQTEVRSALKHKAEKESQ